MSPPPWSSPRTADAMDTSSSLPTGGEVSAYLDCFRTLANAFVAGAPRDDLAWLAARTFLSLLGPGGSVLVFGRIGDEVEILGSAGDHVGLLAGKLPLSLLPEVGAALQARELIVSCPTGLRHPFFAGATAMLARIMAGDVIVGVLAGYLPAGEQTPNENTVSRSAAELTQLLGAAFRHGGERQPPQAARDRPRPSAASERGEDLPLLSWPARGFGTPVALEQVARHSGHRTTDEPGLLRAVLDALPYAVTVVGADGHPLLRNAAALTATSTGGSGTVTGAGAGQSRAGERTAGGTASLSSPASGLRLSGGQDFDARFAYQHPVTGDERWAATTAFPVRSPLNGELLGTVSLVRDITVQVEAEEERDWLFQQTQAQRELLDQLIESAPVSILLLDAGLRVRLANQRFLEALTPQERRRGVLGRSISEIVPPQVADWHAGTVATVLLRGAGVTHPEVRFLLNGAEVLWEVAATPVKDASGEITGVLICSHDVTTRVHASRKAERLLAEVSAERERIRAVLDLIPGGVVAVDTAHGQFIYVNQAALSMAARPGAVVGGPAFTSEGRFFWELLTPDGAVVEGGDLPLHRALREHRAISGVELQIRRADGSLIPVVVSASPLPGGPDGMPGGAVIVFVDITALKEIERLKDDFLAMASHDLRSPLTMISARVQLLQRSYAEGRATPDNAIRALAAIHEYVQQFIHLATTLLDVTSMQSGRFQVRPELVDLDAVARRTAEQHVAASPLHTLRYTGPSEGLRGRWEEARIAQVVQNLVQNAVKYSPGGGLVEVTVRRDVSGGAACAVLTVRDEGIGIAPEERERIFDRFTRGVGAKRRRLGGTGLGLHICRGIVQAHGGTITVDAASGGGSIFTVTLPLDGPPIDR